MDSLYKMLQMQKPALVSPKPRAVGASGHEMLANDPADLHNVQDALQSETSDRMFQAERLGQVDELKALKGLFMRRQDEMRNGTVETQRPIYEDQMEGNRQSINAGFGGTNPQAEAADYGRGFNEMKAKVPINVAAVQGQYDVQQAETSARGQVDVARQYGQNQFGVQDRVNQGAREYRDFMFPNGPQAGQRAPSFNPKTGAMGATPAPVRDPNLSSLFNPFAIARGNLRGLDPYDVANQARPEVAEFNQRWANIKSAHPAGDDAKKEVDDILKDPRYRNMEVEDLYDVNTTDAQLIEEIRDLLNIARGGQ